MTRQHKHVAHPLKRIQVSAGIMNLTNQKEYRSEKMNTEACKDDNHFLSDKAYH